MTDEQLFKKKMHLSNSISAQSLKLYNDDDKANVMFAYATDRGMESMIVEEILNDRVSFKAAVDKAVTEIARIGPLFWDYEYNGILEKPNIDAIKSAVKWLQKETGQHSLFSHSEILNPNFDKN